MHADLLEAAASSHIWQDACRNSIPLTQTVHRYEAASGPGQAILDWIIHVRMWLPGLPPARLAFRPTRRPSIAAMALQ